MFYFDNSASDISGYKKMLESPSGSGETTIATPCTGTGDVLIAAFASQPGSPGAVDFPAGTARRSHLRDGASRWRTSALAGVHPERGRNGNAHP